MFEHTQHHVTGVETVFSRHGLVSVALWFWAFLPHFLCISWSLWLLTVFLLLVTIQPCCVQFWSHIYVFSADDVTWSYRCNRTCFLALLLTFFPKYLTLTDTVFLCKIKLTVNSPTMGKGTVIILYVTYTSLQSKRNHCTNKQNIMKSV